MEKHRVFAIYFGETIIKVRYPTVDVRGPRWLVILWDIFFARCLVRSGSRSSVRRRRHSRWTFERLKLLKTEEDRSAF